MPLSLADLGSAEREGTIDSFAIAQLLGSKTKKDCYVFLKEREALKAGWKSPINHEHTFEDGNVEKGIALNSVSMQVLRVSGRYVQERTPEGVKVLGCYDDQNRATAQAVIQLYRQRKAEYANEKGKQVSLRTLFLVMFLDSKTQEPLHTLPIIISTAGQAPIQLNEAIDSYRNAWTGALCTSLGKPFSPRDPETNSLCIYNFTFEPYAAKSADGTESRFIAAPTFKGADITAENIEKITGLANSDDTIALYHATEGFDTTYFAASMATSAPVLPYADVPGMPALPTGEDNVLPPANVTIPAELAGASGPAPNPNIPF